MTESKRGWFFRLFGYLYDRDEWIRSQRVYQEDLAQAARLEEERSRSLRESLLRTSEELGRAERTLLEERETRRCREEEYEQELRRRRKVFRDWKMCTFYLDPEGTIRDVEPKDPPLVADYFGADPEDVIGRPANQVIPEEKYFNLYAGLVVAGARDFAMSGKAFESNTIEIGGEAFDIMAYPDWAGEDLRTLRGSIITVVPLRHRGWLERLRARQRLTIDVDEEVGQETALDYCLTMMRAGTRPVYLNFAKNRSVSRTALTSIAKFYKIYKAQGAICVFSNIPKDSADILASLDVDLAHVKAVRPSLGLDMAPETTT